MLHVAFRVTNFQPRGIRAVNAKQNTGLPSVSEMTSSASPFFVSSLARSTPWLFSFSASACGRRSTTLRPAEYVLSSTLSILKIPMPSVSANTRKPQKQEYSPYADHKQQQQDLGQTRSLWINVTHLRAADFGEAKIPKSMPFSIFDGATAIARPEQRFLPQLAFRRFG